jgi:ATP-dependent Clp protease ATP-binding subunit ClpB
VIMTSNIGSQEILAFHEKGGDYDQMKEAVLALLRHHFRPEFLNRVDEAIVFRALEREQVSKIAELLLKKLAQRLAQTADLTLKWDDPVVAYLAERGYDPAYGARPLKRVIQQEVETPLSRQIIAGKINDKDIVTIARSETGIEFR